MKCRPPTFFVILVLILSTHISALRVSWPVSISFSASDARRPSSTRSTDRLNEPWIELLRAKELPGLLKSEVDSLFLNAESLNSYGNKPDCFKRAAGRVRSVCGDLNGEGMHSHERVRAAIMMTLCELSTALQPPPLECAMFSFTSFSTPALWDDVTEEREEDPASCVSALSRSPQSWSSYSGYLREVPQLCHAFRRWNDIDTARKIYTNITLEKLSLLRHLHLREERWEEGVEGWVGAIKDLQDLVQTFKTSFGDRESQFDRFEKDFDKRLDHFKQSLSALHTQEEAGYMHSLSRVDRVLDGVVRRHEQTLLTLLPSLERTVSSYLSEVLLRNTDVFEFGNQIRGQWVELEADFTTMQDSINYLSSMSANIGNTLIQSQTLSHSILNNQLQTQGAVTQMGELAREEMSKINETAVRVMDGIQERELHERQVGLKVWKVVVGILGWITRGLWGVDNAYIHQIARLPLPRIALSLFLFLWYLFRLALSSLMSVLVVLVSSRRLFSGVFSAHANVDLESQPHPQSRYLSPQTFPQLPIPPPIPFQIPRRLDLDPRLFHLYIRSGPRFSRIPDRLCKPNSELPGGQLG